jgi:RNase adapter protein RapZ
MDIIIITGSSGAGKSTALKALEDCGFFCIDNLPQVFLSSYVDVENASTAPRKTALGIDIRNIEAMDQLIIQIKELVAAQKVRLKILYFTASNATLIRRFQETRRKHPLQDQFDLARAIEEEKKLLAPIQELADDIIETDNLTIHELRAIVQSFGAESSQRRMIVIIMSFGFKHGIPLESNFMYDVRSLPNPYFVAELSGLTGSDLAVKKYLFSLPEVNEYWQRMYEFVMFSLERSLAEGRSLVTVSIGCTGGRHRSVAFAEKLSTIEHPNYTFMVKHRDLQEK